MCQSLAHTVAARKPEPRPYVVMDGKLVAWEDATLHVTTHAFLYGTAVFEGVRAYWNSKQKRLFVWELDAHSKRMERNARMLGFDKSPTWETLRDWQLDVLACNDFSQDVYLRPVVYYGAGGIGVHPKKQKQHALVMAMPMGSYYGKGMVSAKVSSWTRIGGSMIPPVAKANGAYVNSYLSGKDARDSGFDEAILLNSRGTVSEGSASNLFLVMNGELVTPGMSADILDGVTRAHLFRLAQDLGITVRERSIARTELYGADEAFFCGTGVEISPIGNIDHVKLGNGKVGPVTAKVQERFNKSVHGEVREYRNLLTPVPKSCRLPLPKSPQSPPSKPAARRR
jgi:branched-chain amino acid aminotransferase